MWQRKRAFGDELAVAGVLSRLPVKSLLRLRRVSKSWNSLISSPYLISSHLRNNKPQALLHQWEAPIVNGGPASIRLWHGEDNRGQSLSLYFGFESPFVGLHAIGSARGLICYYGSQIPQSFILKFIIFNPEIKYFLSVPPPLPSMKPLSVIKGFGFDDTTLDSKIILAHENGWVYLYSLNSGSWKFISHQISWDIRAMDCAIFVKDCFHWLTYQNYQAWTTATYPDHDPCILVFDIKTETFRKILFPERLLGHIQIIEGLDESSIGVVQILNRPRSTLTHVWLMGQNGSWVKIADYEKVDKRNEEKYVLGLRNKDKLYIMSYKRRFMCLGDFFKRNKRLVMRIVSQGIKDKVVHRVVSMELQRLCHRVHTHVPSIALLDKMVA